MIDQNAPTSYDQVPYPGLSYSQSHPDRLATLATLLGTRPAAVERCRVLELGCAVGGNLIPMAYGLSGSHFVGIDSSARQIAEGQASVAALGLENLTLEHLDILDVTADLGQFDYVIAHGVFSWVPPAVQDKILEVCRHSLAPNGVAFVSYNTYPGWHMINMVRDMMLYHTREVADPQSRASQARSFLGFMAEATPGEDSAYGSFLRMYAQVLDGKLSETTARSDALLLHDELEKINEAFYFFQFAERAARHGLQYLAEAEFSKMVGSDLPAQVREALGEMAKSVVDLEQYLDFLRNRTLRQTLLCHEEVVLSRTLKPDRVMGLSMASRARLEASDVDLRSVSVVQFRGHDGALLSTDHPVTKAAMLCLAEVWPRVVPFGQLLSMARRRLDDIAEGGPTGAGDGDLDAQVLATNLLTAYGYSDSLMELHAYVPALALRVGDRPQASSVARLQAQDSGRVTNLRHERVRVDDFDRYLLRHLDGSRDRAALLHALLAGPVADGTLTVQKNGKSDRDNAPIEDLLAEELERRLAWLARAALLVDPSIAGGSVDEPRQ
jgi:methyltransferase-like protein/2-polyprenyl-3-methyl-5-hydroxy-6-metoxy-1,4-benzoquinol methylase